MARHNIVFLYAQVIKKPIIHYDDEGNFTYGMIYVNVVRGLRDAGDKVKYLKTDHPLLMTKEPQLLDIMKDWEENDIVSVKGTIASKNIKKTSYCSNEECKDENGNPTRNSVDGSLLYVNPIFVEKIGHCETKDECMELLANHREISNQVYVVGTLCREPKKIKTKAGLVITQYQVALNRKYKIRTDDPEIKSDYPWVKSYGENAIEDKMRLHTGSVVFIDGFLQARKVKRQVCCERCGKPYGWEDKAMEIVPYEVEYMPGTFYSNEDLEEMHNEKIESIKSRLFSDLSQDELDDDMSDE